MAEPVSTTLAVLGGAEALGSFFGGRSAKKAASKLGRLNASFIRQETAESMRRLSGTHAQTYGQTNAMIGASGLSATGSNQVYLDAMQTEQNAELAWMQKAGEMQAKIARYAAKASGQAAQSQGLAGAIGGITSGVQAFKA